MCTAAVDDVAKENPVKARVKWFNAQKGFGFVVPIEGNNKEDAFLHITTLQKNGHFFLSEGTLVICRIDYGDKGATVKEIYEVSKETVPAEVTEEEAAELFRTKGSVKGYCSEKGFGFIFPQDGEKDIFVHKSCVEKSGLAALIPGQFVEVAYRLAPKGREAVSVSIVEGGAPA
ncbi:MAG: hypothetical protein GC136_03975 [Alphaproteobacteria bacterium]|nr:hypothetical protein [Alphaproteobacteria bacterium]